MGEFLCLCFLLLLLFAFCLTCYKTSKHLEKLNVSFKDFYFGTKQYDKALLKYKKKKT